MALQKHRVNSASIPDGLMDAGVELVKGMAVARVLNATTGVYEIQKPTTGVDVYGFVTLREDEAVYRISHYDTIEAGKKAVVYTLVKDHEWRTDQFAGALVKGDLCIANTDGKVCKLPADSKLSPIFEVIDVQDAGYGYENQMVIVKVL